MTKIVTIIIIVSTVWSVISGIIEKNKKAKLSEQRNMGLKTGQAQPQLQGETPAELFEARINSLRRRPKKSAPAFPKSVEDQELKLQAKKSIHSHIKPLHKPVCPIPQVKATKRRQTRAQAVSKLLKTPRSMRTAMILSEVISKPVSQR